MFVKNPLEESRHEKEMVVMSMIQFGVFMLSVPPSSEFLLEQTSEPLLTLKNSSTPPGLPLHT